MVALSPVRGPCPPQTGEIGATHGGRPIEDARLYARPLSRDVAALAETYDQFAPTVFGVALRVTNDRRAAQDVTQDVLLHLWRRPERFDSGRGGLRPWPATIAHNRSVDWMRRDEAARGRDQCDLAMILAGEVPDVDVHAWMTAQRVRMALSSLPECEHTAIRLAYFDGLTYRQMAAELDVPEGTIKSRIRSGLRRLSLSMYAEHLVSS
jgi:RNA polymerase sigma factor (sigma-70 family)